MIVAFLFPVQSYFHSMFKVGITGGMGSGKSTVAHVFETLGIPVYYADDAAKRMMNEHEPLKQQLIQQFGEQTYENGQLNRAYLASKVFKNADQLAILNNIIHPVTIADANAWMNKQQAPYCLKEAALIFESGGHQHLDQVVGVAAPTALRIHRVMQRDQFSREEIIQRMSKQMSESIKLKLCDFVVINDDQRLVIPQVLKIHEQLLQLALA